MVKKVVFIVVCVVFVYGIYDFYRSKNISKFYVDVPKKNLLLTEAGVNNSANNGETKIAIGVSKNNLSDNKFEEPNSKKSLENIAPVLEKPVEPQNGAENKEIKKLVKNYDNEDLHEAVSNLTEGRFLEAIYYAKACLKSNQNEAECSSTLAKAYMGRNELEKAEEAVSSCLRIMPNSLQCQDSKAYLSMHRGDYEQALKQFQGMLDATTEKTEISKAHVYRQIAITYTAMGEKDKMIEYLKKACVLGDVMSCETLELIQ